MRRLIVLSALASLALAGPVLAAAKAAPAKPAAAPAAKGGVAKWNVDKAASKLGFKSTFSGTAFEGAFKTWTADIAFDPKNLAASKAVVSVDLVSAATGDESRDESLPTDDWFATGKFPKATFTTTAIKDMGGGKYQAAANLNLRGVVKPVTLNFTLAITGDTAKMNGTATVDRSQFGVGQGQWKAADTVPFPVTVVVNITAKRAG
ncbi:MAG: YceI family protein [Caulobacteraceae bacterium]